MQDTHIADHVKALHAALITIVGAMNRPRNDERLIGEAGIRLDRALFAVLVTVERLGPTGIVELAERVGRDYTTVSRQVARFEELGLVARREHAGDRRVRAAVISAEGRAMTRRIDAARARIAKRIFRDWEPGELE